MYQNFILISLKRVLTCNTKEGLIGIVRQLDPKIHIESNGQT